ncbi:MAG TPA: Cache 3/Cache 2 fusion domain-containing protein, partial [Desulfuromonadales bacterium]|nr:Cache 3/Cache 2 fusion domain-containing protein [Desulfuromonadales bacterium]
GNLLQPGAEAGKSLLAEEDANGRKIIREIIAKALHAPAGKALVVTSDLPNAGKGTGRLTRITVFRYFKAWGWILAASRDIDETIGDTPFERQSFKELKASIESKKVGKTGYIFCMTDKGTFTIHPDAEGRNFYDAKDMKGRHFIKEMCKKKNGWIRYPWENIGDDTPRMKIVRYVYFAPWHWIVAVGSYQDEFYQEANAIEGRTIAGVLFLTFVIGLLSVILVFSAASLLTQPIHDMIDVIRKVKQGRLDQQMEIDCNDEFGELAAAFNRMTGIIQRNKEMESALAQQGKMASLGVLSSGVAHEINNPLGVILGYASYLEGKIADDEPTHYYIHEIKRESKRCKKIVQDLLSYARTPKPTLVETDINTLLGQIVDFAANHTDMRNVTVIRDFTPDLPSIQVDGDQLRQIAINLILNAGAAMPDGGKLVIRTLTDDEGYFDIVFSDNGSGIPDENVDKIFEPFFTTKARGTGLGLAITKQIIEQHQGKISLLSKAGQGTTVTVRLPIDREDY